MDTQGRNGSTRPLERIAPTGIYLARGIPRDVQRAARVRALREETTLRWVLVQALLEYAEGRWTPRWTGPSPDRVEGGSQAVTD